MRKVKNPHDIITLVLPTNEPKVFMKYFLPSLENMKVIAPISTIAINFQDPWKPDMCQFCVNKIKELGFSVKSQLVGKYHIESKGLVPFNKIRNDAVMLNPDSLFYALTDDDFKYLQESAKSPDAGTQYLRAIHYLLKFENCGMVLFGGTMYRHIPINHIGITKTINNEWYITGKGFILRSMSPEFPLFPSDSIDLKGAKEECLLAAARINKGLYPAKMGNARIYHDEVRKKDKDVQPGYEMYDWLKENIIEDNVNKYIRDHYCKDMHGVYCYNVVDENHYHEIGGPDHKKDYDKYLVNYTDTTVNELMKEVINMAVECEEVNNDI